jgi:hypothetical protein
LQLENTKLKDLVSDKIRGFIMWQNDPIVMTALKHAAVDTSLTVPTIKHLRSVSDVSRIAKYSFMRANGILYVFTSSKVRERTIEVLESSASEICQNNKRLSRHES